MNYQVGDIVILDINDPCYDDVDTATKEAVKLSEQDRYGFYGIWNDGELIRIIHGGEVFSK